LEAIGRHPRCNPVARYFIYEDTLKKILHQILQMQSFSERFEKLCMKTLHELFKNDFGYFNFNIQKLRQSSTGVRKLFKRQSHVQVTADCK
jgi:glutathionylspermidine synthase